MYMLLYILNNKEGDDFMQATIQKWGNSQGIRNELTLDDIFKDYNGESVAKEFDWNSPVGREVW